MHFENRKRRAEGNRMNRREARLLVPMEADAGDCLCGPVGARGV